MNELVPGVFHWTAPHPRIKVEVSSYYLAGPRTLLDPMVPPEEGLDWFRDGHPVERIVLTNRHHSRESARFVETLGVPVLAPEAGLHEFEGKELEVEPYRPGDEVAHGEAGAGREGEPAPVRRQVRGLGTTAGRRFEPRAAAPAPLR